MHHFTTGDGKSGSFYLYSENRMLLIKTIKVKELEVLTETDFLKDLFLHFMKNPKSMIGRYLGVYKFIVNN